MLSSVAQNLEDLGHLPARSQVHPEAGHGAARGQADYTEAAIKTDSRNDYVWSVCRLLNLLVNQKQHLGDVKRISFALVAFVFSHSWFAHEKAQKNVFSKSNL